MLRSLQVGSLNFLNPVSASSHDRRLKKTGTRDKLALIPFLCASASFISKVQLGEVVALEMFRRSDREFRLEGVLQWNRISSEFYITYKRSQSSTPPTTVP